MADTNQNIRIKEVIPVRGTHTFDVKGHINIFDPSTFQDKKMIPEEYNKNFQYNFVDDIGDKDKIRIFILSEYLKRKFYITLLGKDNDKVEKKKNKLEQITSEDIICNIANKVGLDSKAITILKTNLKPYEFTSLIKFNNYFQIVKFLYHYSFAKFRKIIYLFSKGQNKCFINDSKSVSTYFENHKLTPYLFERLLYLQTGSLPFIKCGNSEIGKISSILTKYGIFFPFFYFATIHKAIVDRYKLYLYDILKISDMGEILDNKNYVYKLPRFFFIPLEPQVSDTLCSATNFNFNSANNCISITIDITNNIDSCELAKYIYDNIILGMYQMKEDMQLQYSKTEISFISALIDSDNPHNNKSDITIRLYGLYIWDKLYRYKNENKISEAILHFCQKYNDIKTLTKTVRRKFERYLEGTIRCIETGKFLPLLKK